MAARRRVPEQPLHWISVGGSAGESVTLPAAAVRRIDLRILASGQGPLTARSLVDVMPGLVEALAAGTLIVQTETAPLGEAERAWTRPVAPGHRLVLTMTPPPETQQS